jgi:hypothetical protein
MWKSKVISVKYFMNGSEGTEVIINNTILNGLQNVSFQQSVNETPAVVAGNEFASSFINGPAVVSASVDKLLTNTDFCTGLVLQTGISGQFIHGSKKMDFHNLTINGFAVTAEVGQVPNLSFDFSIYGGMSGSNIDQKTPASGETPVQVIPQTGIKITYDKDASLPVSAFQFSETYDYQAVYGLNSSAQTTGVAPVDVKLANVIPQEVTISIDVNDHYEIEKTFELHSVDKNRQRDVKLQLYDTSGNITNQFSLFSGHYRGETITQGVGDTVTANISYGGFKRS